MRIPAFIRENLLLKITSLNTVVIGIRLVVSFFIQRLLAVLVGEEGISKIGQLRNITQLLTSLASFGIFSGVVKYVAEYKEDKEQLQKLFSTSLLFVLIGTVVTALLLFFGANAISERLFTSQDYTYLIKILAVLVPVISVHRIFTGVVNGLSMYKKYAKIDLFGYLASAVLMVYFLYEYNIDGALLAIALTPLIQLTVLLIIFTKTLREYIQFSKLRIKTSFAKGLLAFSLMSFFSSVLLNYVELDIRTMIMTRITEADAGIWTAMTFISKNYMVFSGSLFTLYVLPKFASITTERAFKRELFTIYKTLLPLFGIGMIVIYVLRDYIILLIYPDFTEMAPLFKWQLLGDFLRLASLVLLHQFLAKKLVRSFIFSELISLGLFYGLSYYFVDIYGVEGVVIAHFLRYIVYLLVVLFLVLRYFKKQKRKTETPSDA
ncbi:O-antigen translocase [Altibacter sp.]|uniref:O-antigen translocase n=1 Tax=Altibacter sp. TaxID=2024823 RepID=UPI00258E3049|nr:O-antigen translocase [Altibacter sp.]MCW9037488.1 O-antigen translocase [Altibacter sp.]